MDIAEGDSTTAVVEPATGVNWHLSPGYSTHLHAYELAMLPNDRGLAVEHGKRA